MRGARTEFCQALKEPLVLATASTPSNLKTINGNPPPVRRRGTVRETSIGPFRDQYARTR